jgi:hypothetical protein
VFPETEQALQALVQRGDLALQERRWSTAEEIFAQVYDQSQVAGDRRLAARATLGQAQADFARRRLETAARLANVALDMLTELAAPEARQAADLLAQIDHNRYLYGEP